MKKLVFMFLSCSVMIFINGCATLQDSHTNYNSTVISGEWEMLEFLSGDEGINKRVEVDNCRAKGDDSAQCDKILDTWHKSCARGEEKYCIGVLAIHSNSYFASLTIRPTSLYECSEMDNPLPKQNCDNEGRKIDKSLTLLKQNCNNGMANSCYAVGDFYNGLYLEIRSKEESYIAPQMLDEALLYLKKSCGLGVAISCIYIAQYEHFQGTKQVKIYANKARKKARKIVNRDCKAGVEMACDFKKNLLD